MADVTKTVKDAVYVGVGFGVLAFQRAQVQRRELTKQVEMHFTQLEGTTEQLQKLARQVEERLNPVLSQLEERLPDNARDVVRQAREAAKGQVRKARPAPRTKAA